MHKSLLHYFAVMAVALGARAEQTVVFDEDVHWEDEAEYERVYTGEVAQYHHGTAYIRMDVTSKPTDYEVGVQVCIWHYHPGLGEACSWADQTRFSEEGIHYLDMGQPSEWWSGEAGVDWSGNMSDWQDMRVLLRDPANGMCQFRASGPGACSNIGQHLPILFHVELIFVAEGDRLAPPQGWECPADWGCEESVSNDAPGFPDGSKAQTRNLRATLRPDGTVLISIPETGRANGVVTIHNAHGAVVATIATSSNSAWACWNPPSRPVSPGAYVASLATSSARTAAVVTLLR
jgi:hypothetical protein